MKYFTNIPKIYYDFNIGGENVSVVLKDLTTNVRFKTEILKDVSLYDEYDIREGETPDILADKLYGSPLFHWVILLLNDRLDYINDWPMSSFQLESHIEATYGPGSADLTHHYEDLSGKTLVSVTPYLDPYFTPVTVLCDTLAGTYEVVAHTPGEFADLNDGSTYSVKGAALDPDTTSVEFLSNSRITISHPMFSTSDPNGIEITFYRLVVPEYKTVTNFEYEVAENEKKRRIKVIHPSVLPIVLNQLRSLTNA